METNRLDSWIDRQEKKNEALGEVIAEDSYTFDVYRNVSNDGFTTDGDLENIGSLNGKLVKVDDNFTVVTDTKLIYKDDVLECEDLKLKITDVSKDEETDSTVAKVLKI